VILPLLVAGPFWEENDLVFTNRVGPFLGVKELYLAYERVQKGLGSDTPGSMIFATPPPL
jgi:hypothetical protein